MTSVVFFILFVIEPHHLLQEKGRMVYHHVGLHAIVNLTVIFMISGGHHEFSSILASLL